MITTPTGPKFMKNNGQSGAKSGDHTHAALNLRQLITMGLNHTGTTWAIA